MTKFPNLVVGGFAPLVFFQAQHKINEKAQQLVQCALNENFVLRGLYLLHFIFFITHEWA